jgi:DNA invertase Pin-like site-specific DNA recombinase
MKKAFAYLRVSGKGQVDGDGFPRQLGAIKQYATQHNITIVKVYREEGISGTTEWDNRPAFSDMMAELLSDGTRVVLIERLDRIARELLVQESIISDFKRKRLTLVSVNEPDLGSNDASRVAFRQLMGVFAQYEKTVLVAKLKAARQRKRLTTGRCEGAKPFGTLPGEEPIVDRMRTLRATGLPLVKIAHTLNQEGIKPRSGKQWYPTTVQRILKALG